jgi:hypothetical protein
LGIRVEHRFVRNQREFWVHLLHLSVFLVRKHRPVPGIFSSV